MAQFTCLYSGSSGNCSIVSDEGKFLLIDMGKSTRKTLECLKHMGHDIKNLCAVLVTHEHSDHTYGLTTFLKKHDVPIFATAPTIKELKKSRTIPHFANACEIKEQEFINGFTVQSFNTSHDSAQCCGFKITTQGGKTVAIATDLGCVTGEVYDNLCGADVISLEANYDYNMLINGPYPSFLKQRIHSSKGHLCNEDSAKTVMKLMQDGCKNFMLCHMSKENNTEWHVLQALKNELAINAYTPQNGCVVQVAYRNDISPVFDF